MLRHFFSLIFVLLVTLSLVMHEAEAKRFGGGRSFGMQRSSSTFNRSTSSIGSAGSSFAQKLNQPGSTASTASKWLGPLAGLAAGGLLASLFMSNGLGSGILSWLLVGGLLLLAISFIRNRMQPASSQVNPYEGQRNNFAQEAASQFMRNSSAQAAQGPVPVFPVGFDEVSFLREAKVQFIRLQAAYDQKNLNDLREFTTPEVFAEIQLQFQERGNEDNKTDVVTLDTQLLDVSTEPQMIGNTDMQAMIASVRFSGLIQENRNGPAATVNEIWHFKKEAASQRWLVAGIQQN